MCRRVQNQTENRFDKQKVKMVELLARLLPNRAAPGELPT
jgi:hypothetical protein